MRSVAVYFMLYDVDDFDDLQEYDIDFKEGLQISRLGCRRMIFRKAVDILLTGKEAWCYMGDDNIWRRFDSMAQKTIAKAYSDYTRGRGLSQAEITFPGSPDKYILDFAANTQTNKRTGKPRRIGLRT